MLEVRTMKLKEEREERLEDLKTQYQSLTRHLSSLNQRKLEANREEERSHSTCMTMSLRMQNSYQIDSGSMNHSKISFRNQIRKMGLRIRCSDRLLNKIITSTSMGGTLIRTLEGMMEGCLSLKIRWIRLI